MSTEPDYEFSFEHVDCNSVKNAIFFGTEVLVLKSTNGNAKIIINGEMHTFEKNTNFLLMDGVLLKMVDCSSDFSMDVFHFSQNFMNGIYPFLKNDIFEVIASSAPDLYSKDNMMLSDLLYQQLYVLYNSKDHVYKGKMAVNTMLNYVYEIYEQTKKHVGIKTVTSNNRMEFILDRFYTMCIEKYKEHRNIDYYAEKLCITTRYLHKVCKETIQMTPKECIDYITIGSVKRKLLTSDLTTQQISIALNFPDQATFGQYFKRNVGMSATEFRKLYK